MKEIKEVVNKSKLFLLPMLFNIKDKNNLSYLKGTFLGDLERLDFENKIHMLFEFNYITVNYKLNLEYLKSSKYYVDNYYPDDFRTMIVYDVPQEYQKDYKLFKNSRYSEVSDILKLRIQNFWGWKDADESVKKLNKNEEARKNLEEKLNCHISPDAELLSILEVNKEYFHSGFKKYKTILDKIKNDFNDNEKIDGI